MTKICNTCGESKPLFDFHNTVKTSDGKARQCRSCKSECDRLYRAANSEKLLAQKRQYYTNNKVAFSERSKRYYQTNQDAIKSRVAQWKRDNPDKVNALCMKRYTGKMQARPKWLTEDELWMMDEAYSLAKLREEVVGGKWDVDHIVPLRGKKVCGLHVPWNLAVVPAAVNRSKGNKFDVL